MREIDENLAQSEDGENVKPWGKDPDYPRYGTYTLEDGMIKSVEGMGDGRYIIYYSWEGVST